MRRIRWAWAAAAAPLIVGLIVFALLNLGGLRNPIVYLRADTGALTLMLGITLSLITAAGIGLIAWSQRELRREVADLHRQSLEEHHRFLRRLDHELKNPLTAIRAGLANLAVLPGLSQHQSDVRDNVADIDSQVMRLSRLLRDLRKLAELETQPIERMQIDLSDLLNEVLSLAEERPEAADRKIRLTLPEAPWPLPLISGDWDLLFLALHNLLDNAIKYTLPGNRIEIRAFEDGPTVVIEIADTGPGIPEGELPHVWEELSRGYSARGVPGSGLGLPLVKTIIDRHGGRVLLRSRAGHGTVFTIRLPISAVTHTRQI